MKKDKSDLKKWHEEYRKKHPEWKENRAILSVSLSASKMTSLKI